MTNSCSSGQHRHRPLLLLAVCNGCNDQLSGTGSSCLTCELRDVDQRDMSPPSQGRGASHPPGCVLNVKLLERPKSTTRMRLLREQCIH